MEYWVRRAVGTTELRGDWEGRFWQRAPVATLGHFHAKSSDHHPLTQARVLYDDRWLYLIFRVEDRYVRAIRKGFQQPVCLDSCVEFFVQPDPGQGYLNFEVNCGGALLLNCNAKEGRTASGQHQKEPVDDSWLRQIRIFHSLPETVEPELTQPTVWLVEYSVPLALFGAYIRDPGPRSGALWRANFYKCADQTSHPHWGSWNPVGTRLDFHQPACFGELRFE